jgi:hypothetical protein
VTKSNTLLVTEGLLSTKVSLYPVESHSKSSAGDQNTRICDI